MTRKARLDRRFVCSPSSWEAYSSSGARPVPSLIGYHGMTDQNPTWSQALAEFRRGGGRAVLDQLLPGVYRELCAIAHRQLMVVPPGGSLQTSELVHEAYLKLVDQRGA